MYIMLHVYNIIYMFQPCYMYIITYIIILCLQSINFPFWVENELQKVKFTKLSNARKRVKVL